MALRALGCAIGCSMSVFVGSRAGYDITARRFSSARLQPSSDAWMASVSAKRRISGREQPSRLNSIESKEHTNEFAIEMSPVMGG